jgi:hypothetical protein
MIPITASRPLVVLVPPTDALVAPGLAVPALHGVDWAVAAG